jgi:hypothetical protein
LRRLDRRELGDLAFRHVLVSVFLVQRIISRFQLRSCLWATANIILIQPIDKPSEATRYTVFYQNRTVAADDLASRPSFRSMVTVVTLVTGLVTI